MVIKKSEKWLALWPFAFVGMFYAYSFWPEHHLGSVLGMIAAYCGMAFSWFMSGVFWESLEFLD